MNQERNVSPPIQQTDEDHALKHKLEQHDKLLKQMAQNNIGLHYFKPDFDQIIEEDPIKKKMNEDKRYDFIVRMKNSFHESYDNPGWVHPHGMTDYDYRSISETRRDGFETFKMKTRRENYIYLNQHTEIDALMSLFFQKLFKSQPSNPVKFAGEFFTLKGTTLEEFTKLIEDEKIKIKTHRNINYNTNDWSFSSSSPSSSSSPIHDIKDVNEILSLNIGPVADGFNITHSPPCTAKSENIIHVIKPPVIIHPPTPPPEIKLDEDESEWEGEYEEYPIPFSYELIQNETETEMEESNEEQHHHEENNKKISLP